MSTQIGIVMLARAPIAGNCKSRLAVDTGARYAASLSEVMLWDTIDRLNEVSASRRVVLATSGFSAYVSEHSASHALRDWKSIETEAGAFDEAMKLGLGGALPNCDFKLLAVSDAPFFDVAQINSAMHGLKSGVGRGFIAPSPDGGFSLLCVPGSLDTAWCSEIAWGTADVLASTERALAKIGVTLDSLEPVPDIDEIQDIVNILNSESHAKTISRQVRDALRRAPGIVYQDDGRIALVTSIVCDESDSIAAYAPSDVKEASSQLIQSIFGKVKKTGERAECLILLGQPGAGKTDLANSGQLDLAPNVSVDQFRSFHPAFQDIIERYPYCVPHFTARFAAEAWQNTVEFAFSNRLSFSTEVTGRNPRATREFIGKVIENEFCVRVVLLRCPPAVSWLSIFSRFMKEFKKGARIHFVDPRVHLASFDVLADTLRVIEEERTNLEVSFVTRLGISPVSHLAIVEDSNAPFDELLLKDDRLVDGPARLELAREHKLVADFFSEQTPRHPVLRPARNAFLANDIGTPDVIQEIRSTSGSS